MGVLDSNGIYLYDETDERDTFSALLNIGQGATSDAILATRARVGVLEAKDAITALTTGIATASSGWSFAAGYARGRKKNGIAFVDFSFTRNGGAITVPSDGNITNQIVGTLNAGWQHAAGLNFALAAGGDGPLTAGVAGNNNIYLTSVAPGSTINNGTVLSLVGQFILA